MKMFCIRCRQQVDHDTKEGNLVCIDCGSITQSLFELQKSLMELNVIESHKGQHKEKEANTA